MKIVVVCLPFPVISGGTRRTFEILKRLPKQGFDVELIFPPREIVFLPNTVSMAGKNEKYCENVLSELEKAGISINDYCLDLLFQTFEKRGAVAETKTYLESLFFMGSYIKQIKEITNNLATTPDGIYSPALLDSVFLSYHLAKKTGKKIAIFAQLPPFPSMKNMFQTNDTVSFIYKSLKVHQKKKLFKKIVDSGHFTKLLTLSPAILNKPLLERLGVNFDIIYPPVAFGEGIGKYSNNDKENYAIYFARLNRRKGLFEIPFIWKEIVKEYPEMKLKIFGRGKEKSIQKFERIAKKLGIIDSIEVVGYVTREELLSSISKARLFIYPSHEDCYPLAMLETLFVGTPIVAYGITPIRYIYESIKAVELVPEGDIKKNGENGNTYSKE